MQDVSMFDFTVFDCDIVGTRRKQYLDIIACFDIETSTVGNDNFMYIWQFAVKLPGQDAQSYYGRTWVEYVELMRKIDKVCKVKLKIFVHNLAYEWQYLRSFVDILQIRDVFMGESRKPMKFCMLENIEYYCSYKLLNMSLALATSSYDVTHKKLPEYDYREVIYPDTPLRPNQIAYADNDVLGLCEVLEVNNTVNGDTIATMPLTSTGYVRRDIRDNLSLDAKSTVRHIFPSADIYHLLEKAFRGGNTHANRIYVGDVLQDVKSYDRVSSYPAVQLMHPYPVTPFVRVEPHVDTFAYAYRRGDAILATICLYGVEANPDNGCPYIPVAKCRNLRGYINDNGRVLQADYLEISVTDIDYQIIQETYQIKQWAVSELYIAHYGYLDTCYTDVICKYFVQKTDLKGKNPLLYMRSKSKLNGIYGMSATKPVKDTVVYVNNDYQEMEINVDEELSKEYNKAFFAYQWGVWCTAWARWELQRAINLCGINFVYCDTDSVKYINDVDFTPLNKSLTQLADKRQAYAVRNGKKVYMGIWEEEKGYEQFKTLGAKKYVYVQDGDLHITIAGVNKAKGAAELGSIDNFRPDFVFRAAGGTESVFDDRIGWWAHQVNGHWVEHTSNVIIRDSTYTLDLTASYYELLDNLGKQRVWKTIQKLLAGQVHDNPAAEARYNRQHKKGRE